VTFGGGVRYEDSLAPSGWVNIPHLAKELVPQGLVYPSARYDGITGTSTRPARSSPAAARKWTPTAARRR
jgi:hypothetical protein